MALDLGTLFATLDIKDDGWSQKISKAKTDLADLSKAAEAAAKVKIDVTPTGAEKLDDAADAAKKLDDAQKQADKTTVDVAPTGADKVDKAKKSTDDLGKSLDTAGKKKPDVAPKGTSELDKAADSAGDLGKELEQAGRVKPNVTPTGTGDVTRAADEARRLGQELEQAKSSAKTFTIPQNLSNEVGAVGKATGSLVDSLGSVSSKAIKWGAMTAGASAAAAAVGGVGTALTAGFSRLNSIDQAEAKLTGLGHSAEAITGIMDSAMASVKGTAFGFGEAAGLAGQMVASGIEPGERLTEVLTTVADTATIGGRSLEDMGLIFGSVAAKGKLQGDDLMQLMAGGIPVLQMLSDELGKTTEEVSDMASSGEIDFATFESAMRNHLGGAAQAAGDTFSGAMDNAKAAAGRLGAAFLEPMFGAAPGIIGNITDKIDELGPQAEAAGAKLSEVAHGAIPHVKAALDTLKGSAETVWPVVQKIGDVAMGIPWQAYAGVIAMAVSKHQGLTGALSSGSGKFKAFTTEVAANRAAMQQQGHQIGVVSAAIQTLGTKSSTIGKMSQAFQSASTPLRIIGMDAKDAAKETTGLQRAALTAKGGLSSFGGVLSGSVAGGFSLAKSGAKGLMTALGGPWGLAIGGATAVIGTLIAKHQEAKAAEEQHKAAQEELRGSLDQTTGAITEQTTALQLKALEESGMRQVGTELGLSSETMAGAMTGNAQAMQEVNAAIDASLENAGEANSKWQQFGDSFTAMDISYTDIANAAEGVAGAQEKINSKLGDMDPAMAGVFRDYIDDIQNNMGDAEKNAAKLRGEVGGLNGDFEDASADKAAQQLNGYADEANKAAEALKILDGEKVRLADPTHLAVELDPAKAAEVKTQLEEIGLSAEYNTETKELSIEFPNGGALAAALSELGGQIVSLPDGTIDVNAMTDDAKQRLVDLGLAAEIDGEVRMKDDIQTQIQRLVELGALAIVDGQLTLGDNIDVVDGKLVAIDGTQVSGDMTVRDNVPQVKGDVDSLNGRNTSSSHTVYVNYQGTTQSAGRAAALEANGLSGDFIGPVVSANGRRLPRNADGSRHGGYRLPTTGPGTGVTDGILGIDGNGVPTSWVDAGEWIVNGDRSEQYDATLAAINSGSPMQVMASLMRDLDHHATGGKTNSARVKEQLGPYNNGQYVMGGFSPDQTDCSGAVSMGVNSYLGRDPFESRMSTVSEGQWLAARGFREGRGDGNDLVVGWYDNGGGAYGHTAMQLPDGTYIESGGNTGQGLTIGGAAGPLDGRGFTNFMYLPADETDSVGGDLGESSGSSGSYASLSGGSSSSSSSGPSKSINGGNGPLIKDGSALEFAAAAYAAQTGTTMPDDVVSWGQVMGVGTEYESDNLERDRRQSERDLRQNQRDIEQAKRDIEEAKADIAEKEKALAEAKPEDKEQAQRDLDDARDKVPELEDKLEELTDKTGELQKTNEQLRIAVERQETSTPSSAGQVLGLTAMADGGILGSARNAQISDGTSAVLWGEAGREAYIPLSKKKDPQSVDLWMQAGKELGIDAVSMLQLMGSGIPGLMEGRLDGFSTGGSVSLDAMGLNTDAAAYRGAQAMAGQQVVGAVFNGPVQVNDPRRWVQGQVNGAGKMLGQAMKGVML
ncbi:tape measure protein [Corynebacterium variabile]|uniref:tape measure protein n=1 Tax=Corynebacterium variabile TaxID=1727 RepID=UPI0028984041|nr:tape measure protein [Corynebacterium variabile]